MRKVIFRLCFVAMLAAPPALAAPAGTAAGAAETAEAAEAAGQAESAPVMLEAIEVGGTYPAPGLWELTRDGKTLLLMGTLSPAPRRMDWGSEQVEARIAGADLVLSPPGVSVGADVGLFRGAMLWPAYRRSKRNPDGTTLADVLSPPVHARWEDMRRRYLPDNDDVDELRPVHAATALFDAAVRDAGLTDRSLVDPVVKRVAKANDIPVRATSLRLAIDDPKAMLAKLNATHLADEDCLVQTMDRLEADLSTMAVRADAWARGDIATLRALPFVDHRKACRHAFASNEIARQQGITDLDARVQAQWLAVVRDALSDHDTVFATLPVARLLDNDGVLAVLRDDGFTVKAPE